MATKRLKRFNKKTRRVRNKPRQKSGKRWVTAIVAAETTLRRTGSYDKARQSLRNQALLNARRLFGSIGERL